MNAAIVQKLFVGGVKIIDLYGRLICLHHLDGVMIVFLKLAINHAVYAFIYSVNNGVSSVTLASALTGGILKSILILLPPRHLILRDRN